MAQPGMERTVWKATLKAKEVQDISVPAGAQILYAREQHDNMCVWFLCDPAAPKEPRTIAIVGTGHPAPDDGRYIGSAHLRGGDLIIHVFEK